MDKLTLEEKILGVFSRIEKLLELEREILEKPVNKNSREALQKISTGVQNAVDSLRVFARYLLFELEARKEETC